MNNFKNANSRIILLFVLILFLVFSCKKDKRNHKIDNLEISNIENLSKGKDSVTISITLPAKIKMGFNVFQKPFDEFHIEFFNPSVKDSTITKKFLNDFGYQVIHYKSFVYENDKLNKIEKYYLIGEEFDNLHFEFINGSIDLIGNKFSDLNSIFNEYNDLTESEAGLVKLSELHSYYKKSFSDGNKVFSELNNFLYVQKIQKSYPSNRKIDSIFDKTNDIILSKLYLNVLYNYTKNRIDTLNFKNIDSRNFSKEYLGLLSYGIYRFLKKEDNKGDVIFKLAIDWLKTTDLYKSDSLHIKKQIEPLDNSSFKTRLGSLSFTNTSGNEKMLNQIVKDNNSQFYLIDFWATWCAPCIQGVKAMSSMNIPNNVKVISVSIDKEKDKQKWIKMTRKLEQPITYWLDETKEKTKQFMKFIEMQSIPRYILIDKNMNLIDQAFYHPQEPQFLPKLQDVKNSKYW